MDPMGKNEDIFEDYKTQGYYCMILVFAVKNGSILGEITTDSRPQ